jgi:hypothetical protein
VLVAGLMLGALASAVVAVLAMGLLGAALALRDEKALPHG